METTRSSAPAARGADGRPRVPWLLVMMLRAAEQHVAVVVGEADLGTADQLRDQLLAAIALHPSTLRVELSGLDFCDLQGLDALHDAARAAEAAGVHLTVSGMSQQLALMHRAFPRPHKAIADTWATGAAGSRGPAPARRVATSQPPDGSPPDGRHR